MPVPSPPADRPSLDTARRSSASRIRSLAAIGILLVLGGCTPTPSPQDYIARLDGHYLSREELEGALQYKPLAQDSVIAAQQVIDQWVTNELLYQEALRRDLSDRDEVKRLLEENQRSVLVSTLLEALYEEQTEVPTAEDLEAYFEQHREQLRIREPFIRVWYLYTNTADAANTVRRQLTQMPEAGTPEADSLWASLVAAHAEDKAASLSIARTYVPESRLRLPSAAARTALLNLRVGQTSRVIAEDTLYHVVHLADRVPAGTIPQLAWIESELKRRIQIENRKLMYARQVQRLRNEALASGDLEIR